MKRSKDFLKSCTCLAYNWVNWLASIVTKLLILFCVLFLIEVISPEKTDIRISLMIVFAIQALEAVRSRFTLFCFESGYVSLKVCFAIPSEMSVVFNFVETIVFNIPQTLSTACKCDVSPFLAVFALENSQVHVCSIDSSDAVADIEAFVN